MRILENINKIIFSILFIPLAAVIYLATSSLIIAILAASFFSFLISLIKGEFTWTAFAAILTLLALIWAVYHQEFKYIINRPELELQFFESEHPYLRDGVEVSIEKTENVIHGKSYRGGIVTIQLKNTGEITARNAEVVLTKTWSKNSDGEWKQDEKWISIPLKWVIPIYDSSGLDIMTRNLTPNRSYLFNVGSFSKRRNGEFLFTYYTSPVSQPETKPSGEYCFEITVYAENIKPQSRYLCIKFKDYNAITEGYVEEIKNSIESIQLLTQIPS